MSKNKELLTKKYPCIEFFFNMYNGNSIEVSNYFFDNSRIFRIDPNKKDFPPEKYEYLIGFAESKENQLKEMHLLRKDSNAGKRAEELSLDISKINFIFLLTRPKDNLKGKVSFEICER